MPGLLIALWLLVIAGSICLLAAPVWIVGDWLDFRVNRYLACLWFWAWIFGVGWVLARLLRWSIEEGII